MLQIGWTSVALSFIPPLVQCVPVSDRFGFPHLPRQNEVITETVVSTFMETSTAITFTTVTSTSSALSTVSMSTATSASSTLDNPGLTQPASATSSVPSDEVVLFLPPGAHMVTTSAPTSPTTGTQSATSSLPSPTPSSSEIAKRQVMAYYPDWAAGTFPPEKIDFNRFDWIDFAFAVPNADFSLGWDGSDDAPDLLRRLVAAAHGSGKYVKLSVGGWTGSK
ncbi:hypothetical protein PHLCEN_2v1609 [Hermanssonia centrifuga]|uniref:GH18 domain-containing protein n=1 Tax=Hermanssonia centrifuga TaxID=98765 RepID=A0A2R6RZJ8_9APHY|nr:hypothetical protein PHLCEN_2v1609 [Hermanssonia centrifuga]